MSKRTNTPNGTGPDQAKKDAERAERLGFSRREFLKSSAAGAVAGAVGGAAMGGNVLGNLAQAAGGGEPNLPDGTGRVLIHGGIVLTVDSDPANPDLEVGDILIEGKKILAIGPNLKKQNPDAFRIDATGMIVCPGFISTHNHQYESIQRSIVADGLIVFAGDADQQRTSTTSPAPGAIYEAYGTIVGSLWTAGRFGSAGNPQWDIGRSPYDPEDCYNAELIAGLSQITQGITCGTDTSQSSHTPEHTDAMILGIIASGRRTLYDYSNGTNRDTAVPPLYKVPYGVPTTPNEYPLVGLQRIASTYFSSKDQLVTLGFSGGPTVMNGLPAPYTGLTGWGLGRVFGAFMNNHNIGAPGTAQTALNNGLAPFDDVTLVHCTRWQDNSEAQISHSKLGYPSPATSSGMQIWADNGGHVSIAVLIEQQMRHGMPPIQMCLNYGIMPSLSPDVDTNMTPDPFSMMRGAFCIQRALANDLAFSATSDPGNLPIPQLITSKQCVEMMTVAGAAGTGLKDKVGKLKVGMEADIVMLEFNNINFQPMNNVYGTVVTMMDTRAVRHVMIAGKVVYWKGKLVGVDVDSVVKKAVQSRDNCIARINGAAVGTDVDIINRGKNSFGHPYRPAYLTSCCHIGLNEFAPEYVLRP